MPDDHTLPPVVQGEDGRFPSIFSVLRAQHPHAQTASIYHWGDFGRLYNRTLVDYDVHQPTADSTAAVAAAYLQQQRPELTFIHLDHVDAAGHEAGHGTAAYLAAIAKADSLVGQVMQGINRAGIAGETVIMIVSDHGGIGKGHGGETPEETTV